MATITVEQALALSDTHLQAGQFLEAERLYRQIVAALPDHAAALHGLGLIALATGHFAAALELISRAIAQAPLQGIYHANLGETYRQLRRMDEAIASFRRALALQPGLPSAKTGLGSALILAGRCEDAVTHYEEVLKKQPETPGALLHYGVALHGTGRTEEAIRCYRRAIVLQPDFSEAHNNLGSALVEKDFLDEAIASFENALRFDPNNAQAHNNLGNAHLHEDRPKKAIAYFRHALALCPNYPEAQSNLGAAFWRIGDLEASACHCQKALETAPGLAAAQWLLASIFLLQGRFREGWIQYEWRFPAGILPRRQFTQPAWDASPLAGQTILLHAEQGLGDTLQFIRYAPLVAQRGGRVIVECQPELKTLLEGTEGISQIIAQGESLPEFDVHCPLMSLPLAFGTRMETIPAAVPYLRADAQKAARWRQRLEQRGGPDSSGRNTLKVGLVWAGGARPHQPAANQIDRRRSILLRQFTPLARVPGVVFVSLQKGDPARQAQTPPVGMTLMDWTDELRHFADTAALVEALDLVISVDTAVAHLAGALGRPVWLLNRFDTCWRWLLERENSPWYPTMRLFRQTTAGDWDSVLQRVAQALATLRE